MVEQIHGVPVLHCAPEGHRLGAERDATDLIGEAWSQQAGTVVIPVARLSEEFFRLETRLLGDFAQKFVNYGIRLVFLGDVSAHAARSRALRSYLRETNRGKHVWFLADHAELTARLAPTG
ncbi:DUF4180 domain-containing protein [Crossiella sp. CA-258035]|uniref:DUF4180 domain-containing protein n=1 Tax=Crossiella sp. CA-258035 TaxID=2981138 RepID=UPI0024BC664E|nr:DUF4180 domain-containing protein [Crossiella sp. CA-258035]WHT23060.1 DUF4180 domain-containing protein [Crossiella sp. CA-258035]